MPALPYPSGEGQFETGAYQNLGHYSDPAMDRMIDESVKKPGLDGLFAYESYFSQQLPVIFFATSLPIVLERDRLHGIADFVNPAGMYAPDQLYCTAGAGAEK
jgi:peptide/nickel transport system substrate-binding protein